MLVVLDSNAFHGDVHANRGLLRAILREEDFELFVPEVVMLELDKHFAADTKKVVREVNAAVAAHRQELRRLDLEVPPRMRRNDADAHGYRAALEARLEAAGATILPVPDDLTPAVAWAVRGRKPFKQSGAGFPDAAIWLSILQLAVERRPEEIVFVSANAGDFAASRQKSGELSSELAADLVARGCPADQVRLVPGIGHFADEIGVKLEPALERVRELADEGRFEAAIEDLYLTTRVSQAALELGFHLDEDPLVDAVTVTEFEIEEASELPGEYLRFEARVELGLSLDLYIFRSDFVEAEEEVRLFGLELDFDQTYLEAQMETGVEVPVVVVTDLDATDVGLEVGELTPTAAERVRRALNGRRLDQFLAALGRDLIGHPVEDFVPEEALESDVDEALVEDVGEEDSVELVEVLGSDDTWITCQLKVDLDADVSWSCNAPTPFDADHFASLALNEESGAPILQSIESRCPLTIDLSATWDLEEGGWRDVVLNTVQLAEAKREGRRGRMTASEEFEIEGLDPDGEPDPA